jgi:hypothetical protein
MLMRKEKKMEKNGAIFKKNVEKFGHIGKKEYFCIRNSAMNDK